MKLTVLLVVMVAALIGAGMMLNRNAHPQDYITKPEDSIAATGERVPAGESPVQAPPKVSPASYLPGRIATVATNRGKFEVILYEKDMPITCKNFIGLVQRGFYKGLKFHRVEDWVIQGGDPKADGTGGSGKAIRMETRPGLGFDKAYTIGMARTARDPNSASSQFFINKSEAPQISGEYAAFGRVFKGQWVVDKIKKGDVINDISFSRPTGNDLALVINIEAPPRGSGTPAPPKSK